MKLIHLGGANCVTGSCHLLVASGLNILIDCGLVQGRDTALPMDQWEIPPENLDYLFLTHAHIDHIGRVPELIDKRFRGEIICTHPTRQLLFPMLEDAMGFSNRSRDEVEKMGHLLDDLAWGFEYNQTFDLKKGVSFRLGNAGHILGSCFIRFEMKKSGKSIVFSGDIGPKDTPILPDPDIPEPCDLLVLESTYGDRIHDDRTRRIKRLEQVLLRALSDGGKVFIPAFALGRCQELMYEMDRVFAGTAFDKPIPVFLDSPLGLNLTHIYSTLSPYWDETARGCLKHGDHPIDFESLYGVKHYKHHLQLIDLPGPAIIIAGSGMCTGGRIFDHLARGLEDSKNDILFVGYQARGTLGQKIVTYSKKPNGYVVMDGQRVEIKARVHVLTGYSAHADQQGLVDWVGAMEQRPKEIRLVHGDPGAKKTLAEKLGI